MCRRLSVIMLSLLVSVWLVGCGEHIGPSDEKAKLDFQEYLNNSFQRVLTLQSFSIDEFKTLSEDRVDVDVTIAVQIDPAVKAEIDNYRDPFGGFSSHPSKRALRKVERINNLGDDEELTLHYQLNPNGFWIFKGYSARES